MDVATIISIVQTILSVLQTPQLRDTWSRWGKKADLDGLKSDVIAIKTVLDDAESMDEELSGQALLYIEELKDVLYDADDLLDEFVTLAKQKQLNQKIIKKVSRFFSRINPLSNASKMSSAVKKIRDKINGINSKHSAFKLDIDHKPIRKRVETLSVADSQIIGRDDDVKTIVKMLLKDPDVHNDGPSFLTIVGMGGLGKTALAQLVYHNENIKDEFKLRLWTCVSDHGSKTTLDRETILTKLLESATNEKHDGYSMDGVVRKLKEELSRKRFLIVLDDLWTEDREEFQKLVGYLVGVRGSQILVTSRSKETANIVGNGLMYELEGLSSLNSWHLFQLMAFKQTNPNSDEEFIKIGREIVKECANVPLAIRVMGSLLYGQDISKWRSVKDSGVANVRKDQNGIMKILKLSYHNLESPLKSCFSYCALYPKDFEMEKESLIRLWIAQGYIVPLVEGQSIEAASEEYFLVLLRRCFFQDPVKDKRGEIYKFKLHDLMHDVALEVTKKEICTPSSFPRDGNKALRHLSLLRKQYVDYSFSKAPIRTYLHVDTDELFSRNVNKEAMVPTILANYKFLRTLDLSHLGIEILPDSIGKLIHLRYLDLSWNQNIKILPESITKLYNLQTLNLDGCSKLKELPKDFSKLVNLMVLKISYCHELACMPLGIGKLTDLSKLTMFVVPERNSSVEHHVDLEELRPLNKLKGSITIVIHHSEKDTFVKDGVVREGGYISDKEHLTRVRIEFRHEDENAGGVDHEEELLGSLQPHVNLKILKLIGYRGARMRRWEKEDRLATFLPNLVQLRLEDCPEIQCLPSLEKLNKLSSLVLKNLSNLEYVNNQPTTASRPESINEEVALEFPCLERLILEDLPKLRGWHQRSEDNLVTFLPNLVQLHLEGCPEIQCLPSLEKLNQLSSLVLRRLSNLEYVNNQPATSSQSESINEEVALEFRCLERLILEDLPKLRGWHKRPEERIGGDNSSSSSSNHEPCQRSLYLSKLKSLKVNDCLELILVLQCPMLEYLRLRKFNERLRIVNNKPTSFPKLKEVRIDNLAWLHSSLPEDSFQSLIHLALEYDKDVVSLAEFGKVFRACSSSLQTLMIWDCPKLKSVSGVLGKLTALRDLSLRRLPIENLEDEENNGMTWESLGGSLSSLDIVRCRKLKSFPKWMQNLTSLQQLLIWDCSSELHKRCEDPNGEDWPNIKHISTIDLLVD